MMRLPVLALLIFSVAPARALVLHNANVTPESDYLAHAELFPSVGWTFGIENGEDVAFGSGVLIDPHWMLTAAHVVLMDDDDPTSAAETFEFGLGSDYLAPGERHLSSQIFVHPDYRGFEEGPDLALVYYEEPFTSVAPSALYSGEVASLVGQDTHLVGYGVGGTPNTGYVGIAGTKRAGIVPVHSIARPNNTFMEVEFWNFGDRDFRDLGVLGSPGDSGGGWFIEQDGEYLLTGISSIATLSPHYGNSTYATILQYELDWISETMASAPIAGDYNADGEVDSLDYVAWRDAYGSEGGAADGNRDGAVDAADYAIWRDALASSGTAVPEPSALLLALMASLALARRAGSHCEAA